MEKRTLAHRNSESDRDSSQRSLGFVGLSAMVHVGILIGVALAPSFRSQLGTPMTAQAGEEVTYAGSEIADPAAPTTDDGTTEGPTEVLLADPSDASAVALPNSEVVEAKPVEEVQPPPVAAPVVIPVTPPVAKTEIVKPAPKLKSVSTPETVAAKVPEVVTDSESEIAIKTALENARAQKDLPKELDAPEMNEEPTQVATEAEATTPPSVSAPAEEEKVEQARAVDSPPSEEAAAKPTVAETTPEKSSAEETTSGSTTPAAALSETSEPATEKGTGNAAEKSEGAGAPALTAPNAEGAGTLGKSAGGEKGSYGMPAGNTLIRDVRELVAMPGNPKPTYPVQDKLSGKQGTTVLVGRVLQDGKVASIVVEQSSGSRLMDEAAAKAFSKWRFRPGQEGMVRSPVKFQLVGEAKEIPARLRTQ